MYAHYELMKARHDDLTRTAAQRRLVAEVRRSRAPRRPQLATAPARLLASERAQNIRPALSRPQASA